MGKIAVDIALLLPEAIADICVGLNRAENARAFSDLSKPENYCHITLAMMVIDDGLLEIAEDKIREIAGPFDSLHLEISALYTQSHPDGNSSCGLRIRHSDELLKLHRAVMDAFDPFVADNAMGVTEEMFTLDEDETFAEVSKHWVENYWPRHKDPEKYTPHISLKCGQGEFADLPMTFTVSRLALCRLGNYCTCRKILAEVNLA